MAQDILFNVKVNKDTALADWEYLFDQVAKGVDDAKDEINRLLGGTIETVVELKLNPRTGELETRTKVLRSEFDKIEKQRNKILKTEQGSLTNLRQSVNTLKQQRDAIAKYRLALTASGKQVRVIRDEWRRANIEVDKAVASLRQAQSIKIGNIQLPNFSGITNLAGKFNSVAAAVTGIITVIQQVGQAVGQLVQRATQVSQLELSFKSFGVSAQDSAQILNNAKAISLGYGVALESVEKSYKRLTPVILQNGGSVEETTQVISALSARMTGLGLNADQSNRYIEAFAQVMGKGKLQGEELNQQFAEIDGSLRGQIASYVAAKYGITDFEKAMSSGQITADIFKEAIVASAAEIQDNLAGQFDNLQKRISSLNPAQIKEIQKTLNTLSLDNLNKTFGETGKIFAAIGVFVSEFFADITGNFPDINNFFALVGQFLGGTLYGIIVGIGLLIKGIVFLLNGTLKGVRILVTAWGNFNDRISQSLLQFFGLQEWFQNLPGWIKALLNPAKAIGDYMNNFKQRSVEAREALANTLPPVTDIKGQIEAIDLKQQQIKSSVDQTKMAREQALAAAKEELNVLKNNWEQEKQLLKERIEGLKAAKEEAAEGIREQIELQKEAHSQRMEQLNEQLQGLRDQKNEIEERKRAELEDLEKPSAAAQRLLEIRRQELQLKANDRSLSEKERLQAKVDLENIDNRIKKREIEARYAGQLRDINGQIRDKEKEIKDERKASKDALRALTDELKASNKLFDDQIAAINAAIKDNDRALKQKELQQKAEEASLKALENSKPATDALNGALETTVTRTGQAKDNAEKMEQALRRASQIKPPAASAFAGGSVKGGEMRTVNELGKEAFLSASGRLSMINAPAWGQWKAPATGTIIPAHLAAQLDIPKGGINLNTIRTPKAGAPMGSISSNYSRSKTVGDNIINNVTIQSATPVEDAASVMVNLVRQRRAFRR